MRILPVFAMMLLGVLILFAALYTPLAASLTNLSIARAECAASER